MVNRIHFHRRLHRRTYSFTDREVSLTTQLRNPRVQHLGTPLNGSTGEGYKITEFKRVRLETGIGFF